MARTTELAKDIGKEWFVVVVGIGAGTYGAVVLIASSRVSGWLWVAVGFSLVSFVTVRLAFRYLGQRDQALAKVASTPKKIIHEHKFPDFAILSQGDREGIERTASEEAAELDDESG